MRQEEARAGLRSRGGRGRGGTFDMTPYIKAECRRLGVGAVGGAAGEAFVADVEEIGSFGDMFDRGPTQLDSYALEGGREDATRKLMKRFPYLSTMAGRMAQPGIGINHFAVTPGQCGGNLDPPRFAQSLAELTDEDDLPAWPV